MQGLERVDALYQSEEPNLTKPTHIKWKQWETKRERAVQAMKETLTLPLKPSCPSHHRTHCHQDLSIEILSQVWKFFGMWSFQRGSACEYRWATKAPRLIRSGTKCTRIAPQSGCMESLLIFYSVHKTATDRLWDRLHSSTPRAKKLVPLTTGSKVIGVYRRPNKTLQKSTAKRQNTESISPWATDHEILARTSWRYRTFRKLL